MSRSKNDDIQRFPYGIIDELYSVQKYSMVSRSLCVKLPCKTEHLLNRSCTNKSSHTWSRSIRLPRDNLIAKKNFLSDHRSHSSEGVSKMEQIST